MYGIVLFLHTWMRWAALLAGAGATLAAWRTGSKPNEAGRADACGLALMIALDVQLLLGLWLYLALSPYTAGLRANPDVVLQDPVLRFWNVEHLTMMLLTTILVHVGRVMAKSAPTAREKRTRMLVFFGVATVLMTIGIPWPWLERGRPLFRFSW